MNRDHQSFPDSTPTMDCSDFPMLHTCRPRCLWLVATRFRSCATFHLHLFRSDAVQGSPKFLTDPFSIMPWPQTPEELMDTLQPSPIVSKSAAFPVYEAGQPLRSYSFSGLNTFTHCALRPDSSKYLSLHTLCYHCVWRALYSAAG